jgi:hypothetical protein
MPNDEISDEKAMNLIAGILGTNEEWSGAADYLERIADIVAWTGRQHPGDSDPKTYVATRPDQDEEIVTTTMSTLRQNYNEGIAFGQARIIKMLELIAEKNQNYPGDYEVFYGVSAALEMIDKELEGEPKNV